MHKVIEVRVWHLWESCERHTYYVQLVSDEGFTIDPMSYRTGSVYTNFEGLSRDEARDRALIDAADWADFFGLTPTPFVEKDEAGNEVTYEPTMTFDKYTNRRLMGERRKASD